MKKYKLTRNIINIFDNLPVYVVAFDNEANIYFWNKAFELATGYKREEVVGNKEILKRFFPDPEGREEVLRMWKETDWKGKTWEGKFYTKFGTQIYLLVHEISDFISGDKDIFWGIGIDITEYKRAQEKYRTYVQLTTDGIWYFHLKEPVDTTLPEDEQLKLFFERAYLSECNLSYAKMYGFKSPDEIVGVKLKDIMPPDDEENVEYLRMVIRNGYNISGMESVEYDREGRKKYFLNNLIGVKDGKYIIGAWGSQIDITEVKKAEEELLNKDRLITSILKSVNGFIWRAEFKGKNNLNFIYVSSTVKNITGFSEDELEKAYRKNLLKPLREEDRVAILSAIEDALEKGEGVFDIKVFSKTGKPVYIRNIISVEESGEKKLINGIGFDITELVKTTDKLKESERFYSEIINTIPDAFFLHELDGTIVDVNETALKLYKCKKKDLIGKNVKRISSKEYTDKDIREKLERAEKEGYLEFEWKARKITGEEFHARVRLKKVRVLGINYIMALITDISFEKEAIERLKASEERFRKLAENNLVGMGIIENDKLTFVNKKFAEIFGYSVNEIVNRKQTFDFIAPEDLERLKEIIEEVEKEKKESIEYSIRGIKKSGERVHLRVFSSAIRIFNKRSIAVIIIDETEKIRAEERRKQLEAQLFQAQKLEAIGLLAAGIAHDFNNVLGGILGYASYIKELYKNDEKLLSKIELIEKAADKAADLTNKLLGFARKGKYREEIIDIVEAVNNVISIIERTVPKRIKIEKIFPREPLYVKGDLTQIEHVFMNLITNAIDSMKDKGLLKLSVESVDLSEEYIERHIDAEVGRYVKITVEDTGEGIPEEIRDRIFEPFFTTKPPGKGTGLGLSMVYGIVKNHGGFITLYSEVGKGTTFRVYFPEANLGKNESKISKKETPEVNGKKRKVMVVDDEDIIRSVLKDMLESLNFKVIVAENGREAIEKFSEDIELVFIDMNMPEMGGKETYYALKGRYSNIKTIVCTGYSIDYNTRELLRNGVRGFLQKPFSLEALKKKIKEVLGE